MHVVLGQDDEGLHMGEIMLILIHCSDFVYFVVGRQQAVELADLGIHCLTEEVQESNYMCVKQEDLLDYYPLMGYKLNGTYVIIFHHSLPDIQWQEKVCEPFRITWFSVLIGHKM